MTKVIASRRSGTAVTVPGYDGPSLDDVLVQAARLWIGHHRPYYASALYRCALVVTGRVDTLAIDRRWRIYLNPAFVNELSPSRLAAALIHELNHGLRDHAGRARRSPVHDRGDRIRWNLAGDAEINDDLRRDRLDVDGDSWIFPSTLELPEDRLAEWYYAQIKSATIPVVEPPPCGSGAGAGSVPGELAPDDEFAPGLGPYEQDVVRRDVAQAVTTHVRTRGSAPGGLVRWAREVLDPVVDWRRVLSGCIRRAIGAASENGDHTYTRFSRRSATSEDIRFPGRIHHVPEVAVIIDTSASMSDDDVSRALGEVQGILRSAAVAEDSVRVLTVDTRVAFSGRVVDARQVTTMARGGTDLRVGIERAVDSRPRPDVIIVLTDGYTPWPDRRPRASSVIVGLVGSTLQGLGSSRPPMWAQCIEIPPAS